MEVDDPAKAAERQAEQERLQRSARVRKRQEERAAREQEAKAHEEAQHHFSPLIPILSTFSFSMHFSACSDTEI